MRCDGMDAVDTYNVTSEALRIAREERRPTLVEAVTYRFRGHSMADPEEYRTKEQVDEWRKRDPLTVFGDQLVEAGMLSAGEREAMDREAIERVDAAVAFADASPHPSPNDLYDDIYVLGDQVRGWYSVDERTPTPHRGEDETAMDRADLPHAAEHAATAPPGDAVPRGEE
jgi:TPP-dependent pyruvate/acetoin dehydrogenase alpha subunit